MNNLLLLALVIIFFSFTLNLFVSILNIKALRPVLPDDFKAIYNEDEYRKSQEYTRANGVFSLLESSVTTLFTVLLLVSGMFNTIDLWARGFNQSEIITGLIFIGAVGFLFFVLSLPLSIYSTFVIEERFGFNRTSVKTFCLDILKGLLLAIVLGSPLLAFIQWFFLNAGSYGWLYCWAAVVLFSLIVQFIAPVVIMPLFNKFTPLKEGELREAISIYAKKEKFKIQGIFTMDGSKRSSKLNAFFTGFGRFRKIVFFDTLVEKLTTEEIVAVLAHEMGHFKLNHILKMLFASMIQTGIMFFLLSLFLNVPEVSQAFGMEYYSIYSSLLFFGFFYSPVSLLVSIIFNISSRKHEYEADQYASVSTLKPNFLISSLKKLSLANLSNLTPHPLYVFLHYSHPPLLDRLNKLQQIASNNPSVKA